MTTSTHDSELRLALGLAALVALALIAGACSSGSRSGDRLRDASITEVVEARLARVPELATARIDVATYDGVVTLTGWVEDRDASARAERLAGEVEGVVAVRNLIRVGSRVTGK